jgi:hypothetical protein
VSETSEASRATQLIGARSARQVATRGAKSPPKHAFLFWCYKQPELCRNRLLLLRRFNATVPVYALYGGVREQACEFRRLLSPWLDDFWAYEGDEDSRWKWRHGDHLLARWYADRGRDLPFAHVFVAQWDMAVWAPLDRLLAGVAENDVLLSGARDLSEVSDWWYWTRRDSPERSEFERFSAFIEEEYGPKARLLCCQFVVAGMPRAFLHAYAAAARPELGFLEYRVPTLAAAMGFAVRSAPEFEPWWADEPHQAGWRRKLRTLSGEPHPVPLWRMAAELMRPMGRRVFHPVSKPMPLSTLDWAIALAREAYREQIIERVAAARARRAA